MNQSVDVSVSRDGRIRTSVSTSVSPLQAGDSNGVSTINALNRRLGTDICYSLSLDERLGCSCSLTFAGRRLRTEVNVLQSHLFRPEIQNFVDLLVSFPFGT